MLLRGAIFLLSKNLNYLFRRCLNAKYIHSGNSADYAIERSGKHLYIFFEWSDGCRDWKNNLDFPARAYSSGEENWFVHRGFLRVWKSIRDDIRFSVDTLLKNRQITEIICVGYSHGAALAGLATEDMMFVHGDKIKISGFGFGCPRFIWGKLPRSVSERFSVFTAIRNIPDIVTHLPPAFLLYSHPTPILKIGEKGKYTPIRAHFPESYLAETKKYSFI